MGEAPFDKTDSSFILPLFSLSLLKPKQSFYPLLDHHPAGSSLLAQTHSEIPGGGIHIMNPLTLRMRLTLQIKQFQIWGYILAIGKKRKGRKKKESTAKPSPDKADNKH